MQDKSNEITIRSLEDISDNILFECASKIFSDTKVNGEIDIGDYEKRLVDGNYSKTFSWGAFDEEKLIAIVVIGINSYLGKKTAYNIMTGSLPEFRERKIVSTLLEKAIEQLKKNKVESLFLEVMCNNTGAIRTYQKNKFETIRTLMSFAGSGGGQKSKRVKVSHFSDFDFSTILKLNTFNPTFLNSFNSLRQRENELKIYFLTKNKKVVSMAIFDEKNSTVRYFADDQKRTTISKIIKHLLKEKKKILFRDIDNKDKEIIRTLNKLNFKSISNQYEMKVDLI